MDFLKDLKFNSILLIPNGIKDKVLDFYNNNDSLFDVKIQTFRDFKIGLLFDYTNEAIYHVMKNYNVNYGVARNYINNLYFLDKDSYDSDKLNLLVDIKKSLEEKDLLIKDKLFINLLKSKSVLYVYGFDYLNKFQKYLLSLVGNYLEIIYLDKEEHDYIHDVNHYSTMEEEVVSVAENICSLVDNGVSLNNIYIANYSEEYYFTFHKIFKLFNIPYYIKSETSLYDTVIGRYFIDNLDSNLDKLLYTIKRKFNVDNNDYANTCYQRLSNLINSYYWCDDILEIKDLVTQEMRNVKIPTKHYEEEVKTVNIIDNQFDDNEYVFLLGFNLGSIPKIKKDEDYINDSIKTSLMESSIEENEISKNTYLKALKNIKNITISYKDVSPFDVFFPSFLIDGVTLIKKDAKVLYSSYSEEYNKLLFANKVDGLIKFNENDERLPILNNNYSIEYKSYSNKFDGVDKDLLVNKLQTKKFSYSTISNYYKCPFRFYLSFFYRLDKYEQTIDTFIGSLFHKVMEDCINDPTKDIDEAYDAFILENKKTDESDTSIYKRVFSNHDYYFVEKLRPEVHYIVDNIREQYKHSSHDNSSEWHEKCIEFETKNLDLKTNINAILTGVVDKCIVINNDIMVIDYKTGNSDHISPELFEFGLTIQLPIYLYLLKNQNKDFNIVGMYLQHILTGFIKKSETLKKDINQIRINSLRLDGLTLDDENKIKQFDDSYESSQVIQSLSKKADGEWRYKNRIISYEDEDKLYEQIKELIENCINDVSEGKFEIKPINIEGKYDGCSFCSYKDICFKRPGDINYQYIKKKEGDENE